MLQQEMRSYVFICTYMPVSTYLAFWLEVLVRRDKFENRRKNHNYTYTYSLRVRYTVELSHRVPQGHLVVEDPLSTCEPHSRPSRAVFVCGGYFSSLVRYTSWARTMRPSTVFRSFGVSTGMAMTASRSPCETSSRKATTTLSTRIILAVSVRMFVRRSTHHTWHVAARRPV